jgi:pyruvate kinase
MNDNFHKTKIIATMGPSLDSEKKLKQAIEAGANVIRFNFSHSDHKAYSRHIKLIQKISKVLHEPIGIMADIQGPKMRIGSFRDKGGVMLKRNAEFVVTTRDILGTDKIVSTTFKELKACVKKGDDIFLNDGLIKLNVKQVKTDDVICRVIEGGHLSDHKGINLPQTIQNIPVLTSKDKEDIQFSYNKGIGIFAFSFVQTESDLKKIKAYMKRLGGDVLIISKIEKPKAIENLDKIIDMSDGILVARGDLGVEVNLERVPLLQKQMIRSCNDKGKVVITATQMLESMVDNPVPTRAEVSDIANAVYDGTDALMLSAETASGKYPIESVKRMRSIASEVEQSRRFSGSDVGLFSENVAQVISSSAVHAAESVIAQAIVCHTDSGKTAWMISKHHPTIPLIAFTPNRRAYNRMTLFYGVKPILVKHYTSSEKMVEAGDTWLLKMKFCKKGDIVVIVAGELQTKGATNMIKIHKL